MTDLLDQVSFPALGTTAVVLVDDRASLNGARAETERVIAEVDRACSRFREDSELARVNLRPGEPVAVSRWLMDALEVALRGARATDGLVDPTVGTFVREMGYDRDFNEVPPDGPALCVTLRTMAGWRAIDVDRARGTVRMPPGVTLDLGATAKAWCADRAALAAAERTGGGVVVGLGGDLSCAGTAPVGGWSVRVAEDHRAAFAAPGGQKVQILGGGVATSGTSVRRWTRGGQPLHHIIDPFTGRSAADHWRVVTVAAGSCEDANLASTAAIILGPDAPVWLAERGYPARLVGADGTVSYVGGWPVE